ncbi:MAG: glycosyltransferase family 2 protein, partial [Leptolyngbyaceae cyanobacterium]
ISREEAMQHNEINEYTYTLETIIQACQRCMAVTTVPVRTNGYLRPSRLVKSIASYVQRSLFTILRIFITYRPLSFFTILGAIPFGLGFLLSVRWVWLFVTTFEQTGRSHVPSLIFSAILILIGVQCWIFGLIADLMSANRKLLEDIQLRLRRSEIEEHMQKHRTQETIK